MKHFATLGSRYIRTSSSAVSQTRCLASKAASQGYPKTVIFTDFDYEGEEMEPQRRLVVQCVLKTKYSPDLQAQDGNQTH